jgi:hypothetical protein
MAASAYIQNKKSQVEDIDVAQILAQLDDLYTKKLWHQLTLAVMEFVAHPFFQNGGLVEVQIIYNCNIIASVSFTATS